MYGSTHCLQLKAGRGEESPVVFGQDVWDSGGDRRFWTAFWESGFEQKCLAAFPGSVFIPRVPEKVVAAVRFGRAGRKKARHGRKKGVYMPGKKACAGRKEGAGMAGKKVRAWPKKSASRPEKKREQAGKNQ